MMSPEEFTNRSVAGRTPHPRRPASIDGISPGPVRRPITPMPAGQRPAYAVRPPVLQPSPPQPLPAPSTPPSTPKRYRTLIIRILLVSVLMALVVAGALSWTRWQAQKNDPDRIFKEALAHSLSITKLQASIKQAGGGNSIVGFDFSKPDEPVISNEATIQFAGSDFGLAAYGSPINTYISYTKLPAGIDPNLAVIVQGSWVRLKADGRLPTGVNTILANLADPLYQAHGPIIVGNYALESRTQLVDFMLAQGVYKYDRNKVVKKSLDGVEVLVYQVKLNINYLKIANQSAAASHKLLPDTVQAAVDALDRIKDTRATLYITVADHRLQRLELTPLDGRVTVDYSNYNQLELPGEPQTKLTWKDFESAYTQISTQAAAAQAKALTKPSN